jgi:hypothetical protein
MAATGTSSPAGLASWRIAVSWGLCGLLLAGGCAGAQESMDRQGVKVKGGKVLKVFRF